MKKILGLLGAAVLVSVAAPLAMADSFALNVDFCSAPCLGGVTSGGTVTLTLGTGGNGITAGDVKIDVALNSPLQVHQTSGLDAFMFNYTGSDTLVAYNVTTNFGALQGPGSFHEDGAGSFKYILPYGCQPCLGPTSFSLTLHSNSGNLTLASLETTLSGASQVDFAVNVSNGVCTGLIGGGNGTSASTPTVKNPGGTCTAPPGVPEPTSVLLLGTAVAFVAKFAKGYFAS